jgi:hypothetical protein
MRPEVCSVPLVVFKTPTPRPVVKYPEPPTESVVAGEVVPMPTLPGEAPIEKLITSVSAFAEVKAEIAPR